MKKAFVFGLIASFASLLVLTALRFMLGSVTPFEVLSDIIVRLLPTGLFLLGVNTFGTAAKALLLIGLLIVSIVLGGLLGVLWLRLMRAHGWDKNGKRWFSAFGLGLAIWGLEMVSIVPASGRGVWAIAASSWPSELVLSWLLAAFVYSFCLAVLLLVSRHSSIAVVEVDFSRRLFLKRLAYVGAGLALAAVIGNYLWKLIESGRRSLLGTGQMAQEITSNEDFYSVSKNFIPEAIDAQFWKLEINGLVESFRTIDYDQLKSFPPATLFVTLECIGNDVGGQLIGNAKWTGVRLRDILEPLGILSSAKKVVFYGRDDYTDSITLDQAMAENILLAYEMNDQPLPSEHGFPARLVVPGIYGMKNVKWITRIELVDYDYKGFWETAGWSDVAVIQTMSRIDIPGDVERLRPNDSVVIGGVAFGGDRGISQVEISTDRGQTWNKADISRALSPFSWVLWAYSWSPHAEGEYITVVRATDGKGMLQIERSTDPLPDGATGYDRILIVAIPDP